MTFLLKFMLQCSGKLRSALYSTDSFNTLTQLLTEMPKEMSHTVALRNQRVKLKEKLQRYSPGTVKLQVIGSGARGAPRSLYLFSDQSRYLFNCGEGTQRLAHEHKMKLSKLEHIFITHGSWENIGGLPGVALTIQDVGVPEITLHGPEGIEEIFSATRRFVVLRDLSINRANCTANSSFEDNAITINYIPISVENKTRAAALSLTRSPKSESSTEDDTDYYAHERSSPENLTKKKKKKKRSSSAMPGSVEKKTDHFAQIMCYAVKLQPRPGTLCLEKCVDAGVPPGPLLGRLKAGEDIVLDNGTVIRSADVILPNLHQPVILVVECPNLEFLNAFETEPAFFKYQMGEATKDEDMPYLIAHFTSPEIMQHPGYKRWMNKFSPSTIHMILNQSNHCMGSVAVHKIQHKLNMLDPLIFPLLKDSSFQLDTVNGVTQLSDTCNDSSSLNGNFQKEFLTINARTFSKINLRPQQRYNDLQSLKIDPEEFKCELMNIEGFSDELVKLESELSQFGQTSEFPNFIFLGTGSCIPNKVRNTSAILLNISEQTSMLLDCGEGTYGQLVRFFGQDGVNKIISKIKAIYISHLHADHHIGLVGILKAFKTTKPQIPVLLLAPKQIMPWLNLYNKHFEPVLESIHLVPNSNMMYTDYSLDGPAQEELKNILGFDRVETTIVKHCPNAFGISLKHSEGWKVTYSGDTMPSDSLVELGKDSDLLIHEATMEDELISEAKMKLHSTTSQAIEIGKRMGAKFTILTHFSQRYAKLPRLNNTTCIDSNVGIAFDNMKVSLGDLPKLPLLYPALKLMFQEECDELEQKAYKRQLKQERENRKKMKEAQQS